jgi:hypothetical protein
VSLPQLGLSPLLDHARRLVEHGRPGDFRPYSERFIGGASPGSQLFLRVEYVDAGGGAEGIYEPVQIVASLRLHHVLYMFTLAGENAPQPVDGVSTYQPTVRPSSKNWRTIVWRFDSAALA